jgi:hypothetical protein
MKLTYVAKMWIFVLLPFCAVAWYLVIIGIMELCK